MLNIGLLYTAGDSFTLQRSDIFVGPMLLAGANLIRFTGDHIDNASGTVKGERYSKTHWVTAAPAKLSAILDLSIGGSVRCEAEATLLAGTAHSRRLDADRMEIQCELSQNPDLTEFILAAKPLDDLEALWMALDAWGTVIIKRRKAQSTSPPLIITPEKNGFIINTPWSQQQVDRTGLQDMLQPQVGNNYYIQPFMQSTTSEGKPLALQLALNQRHGGAWKSPAVRGVVAIDGALASTRAGGIFFGGPLMGKTPLVDKRSFSRGWSSGVQNRVQCFAVAVAQEVSVLLKGPPALLGMRIGLDAHNRPHLMSVDSRPVSNRSPGRDLEMYRHISEFMVELASPPRASVGKTPDTQMPIRTKMPPDHGVSVCAFSPAATLTSLVSLPAPWFDVSLAHGGRRFLNTLGEHFASLSIKTRPFLSLRLGHALNDPADGRDMSIYGSSAIEDSIGQGLLSYRESEFMRSLRLPLLQFQLELCLRELGGLTPDMLWLEDIDLSASALDSDACTEELNRTAQWFENQCDRLAIDNWGVMVTNPHTERSVELIRELTQAAGRSSRLRFAGTKASKVDPKTISRLAESGLQAVVIAKELEPTAASNALDMDCRLLARWSWNGAVSLDTTLLDSGDNN